MPKAPSGPIIKSTQVDSGLFHLATGWRLGFLGVMVMTIKRGKKSEVRIKLTDGLINYAKSGKTDKKDWQQFNNALAEVGGTIRDAELVGFQVSRTSPAKISFRYDFRLNGKRKNITLGQFPKITVTQARLLAKEKMLSVANGDDPLTDKQVARVEAQNTLQSYLDHDYKLHMESRAIEATKYLSIIRNGFAELLKKPLGSVTKIDLVKWVQCQTKLHNQSTKGYASATITQRHGALKSLMSHALRNGVIETNPFDKLDKLEFSTITETTSQQAKRTYLTLEQQQAFLASVDKYNKKHEGSYHKPMMLILYYMGMRTGDVVSLDWTHIIDTPFTCNISKVLEKGRRKVKTPFIMPMPEPVRDLLRERKKQHGSPTNGLVFPNDKGLRLGKQPLRSCWEWIKEDAGFHDDLELYTLRHNYISWLIMDNVPLPVIAKMIGHTSTDMINRNYGHLIKGATDSAAQRFVDRLKNTA